MLYLGENVTFIAIGLLLALFNRINEQCVKSA